MTCDTIHTNHLFLEQDIVTNLQNADGTIEMGTHEVSEVELVVGRTYEHRTSLSESSDRLTTHVVVCHQTSTIGITFQCLVEELAIEFVHIYLDAKELLILLKESYPCIDVAGAVVTVYHCHEASVRSRHHINHFVGLRQRFLQYNHRERRGTCRDITCTLLDSIGSHHTCTCITLRRTYRNTSLQVSRDIETLSTLGSEEACILTSIQ